MIDPHVHLRDWNQKDKETLKHGFKIAYLAGLNAVFEMPNTDPALTTTELILKRIKDGQKAINELKQTIPNFNMFHGIYAGITKDHNQIKEMVKLFKQNEQVIGFKLFAGHSTGNMGLLEEIIQKEVYQTLTQNDFTGVLAVHCEKESLMNQTPFNPKQPFSHTLARPSEAETESIQDQISFAKLSNFKGTLHIAHISTPQSLFTIENAKKQNLSFKITCGLTPHHAVLYDEMMKDENGMLLKMNPPLRPKEMMQQMYQALLDGRIDWIETDHAPHTLQDKQTKYMSGIPGLPFYPKFIQKLRQDGASEEQIKQLTYTNIIKAFNLKDRIEYSNRGPQTNLEKEYEFDAFQTTN